MAEEAGGRQSGRSDQMMTESREHWSSWDSLYTLSEDTLGEEMEAWETFQFSSLEKTELWTGQRSTASGGG